MGENVKLLAWACGMTPYYVDDQDRVVCDEPSRSARHTPGLGNAIRELTEERDAAVEEAMALHEQVRALADRARRSGPSRREEWLRIYTAVAAGYASAANSSSSRASHLWGEAAATDLLGPLPKPEP